MNLHERNRLERYARRVEDLRLWRTAREHPIEEWRFSAGDGAWQEIKLGDYWPKLALPVYFWGETTVPAEWAGESVELELWLGGEGFVRLSNGVTGGLNPFHRSYPVSHKALGGETAEIEAEVVSKGLFGSPVSEPRITRAALVVPETDVQRLERDLALICETCVELDDHEAIPDLLDLLDDVYGLLSTTWPTGSDVSVTRYLQGFVNPLGSGLFSVPSSVAEKALDINRVGQELWDTPFAASPLEPLPEKARNTVREARTLIGSRLVDLRSKYPPVGRLALTGHAHLDLAWLWPVAETRRKARRTFASVLGLMERHDEFTFNQSSAQLYAWVEEDDPEMFQRIKERVAEGRWEPAGGSWVEPDCQMIGGESFVRQLLYGQRYFETKFLRRSTVAWLPDTFGFSPAIPQLLKGAGIMGFFTYKLNWSESNEFPQDLFEWEGLDGSRVLAHSFKNPGEDYNGDVSPGDLLGTWRNFKGKRLHDESLFSFGWGDGGGGPSEKMLENYTRLKDFPASPRLRMTRVDEFFGSLPKEKLPRWVGELYLELHRGTLTTHGGIKKLNREAEHRLLEAEAFAAIASLYGASYPAAKLESAWKALLLTQFHDILPGTSIREVYEDAWPQLRAVIETAGDLRDAALHCLTEGGPGPGGAVLVANAGLHPQSLSVFLSGHDIHGAADAEGNLLSTQQTTDGLLVHCPSCIVPGLGWAAIYPTAGGTETVGGVSVQEQYGGAVLENECLRVEVGPDGSLHRVYDKEAAREVLDDRGNQIWAYTDKPRRWDAWDIEVNYESEGKELSEPGRISVTEKGPLRGAMRVERYWRDSQIVQTYKLLSGSRRIDVETEIVWHERQVLLRALFPVRIRSHEATFETMYGVVKRPTHYNTTWDSARFEAAAHRFCDLSEPGYGVALLNDGKYGHSARDNVLGISLLRSPLYPDPYADEGEHRFTYSLFPHTGGWIEARVPREAFALNSPLCPVSMTSGITEPLQEVGFVRLEGVELALGALKQAEDGQALILRLYEPYGARGIATLHIDHPIVNVGCTGLLEDSPEKELIVEGDAVRFEVRPFEVLTLRLESRNAER
ncbi:MAG: alpha-mannosidase [Rubrobacteraceae bacterium]